MDEPQKSQSSDSFTPWFFSYFDFVDPQKSREFVREKTRDTNVIDSLNRGLITETEATNHLLARFHTWLADLGGCSDDLRILDSQEARDAMLEYLKHLADK